MVPAYFVLLEKIPLTPNGKIDYKALPPPQIKAGEGYQGPRDAIERKLVEIWGEVLGSRTLSPAGQPQIGINDNFFQLGGHSLKAAMLAAKIHKELNVKLPLAGVFTTPTVKEQARRIKMVPGSQYVSLQRIEKREYYPLSSAQKRLYIMHQMNRHSTAYNISAVLPLAGQRDTEKLEKIFRKLIRRHESLRTSFHMKGGQPVQRVHEYDEVEFQIEYYDIETVEEEEQRTEDRGQKTETQGATHLSSVIRHLSSEFIRPFDLSRAPLVHVGLIQSRESKDILLVNMHHIISDGISQLVMALEFETLYEGHELAPLRVQYKDFSAWQNDLFAGSRLNRQKEYWLNRYAGEVPRLRLPQDHNRPGVFTYAGANYDFTLEKEEAEKFKRLSALNNGTLFMNFLAALETLFYKYTGQTDIIIGTEIAGRPHDDLRQIIGMFVNTLALRNYPEGNKTYEDFLKEVIDSSIKAFENQDVQFEELVDQLELERDPARNPLFDISIVVQNFRQAGENIPQPTGDENITSLKYRNTSSKYDMTFFVLESEQDIYIDIRYYTAVFEESTIKRLAVHFKNLVKAVLEQPAVKLKDIGIISPPERKQLLYDFNETAGEYPKEKTLHRLFAEQVERTPEHIAVVGPSAKKYMTYITYRELNEKSGQLAGYLREKGLKTGTIAGIMAAPSIETLIGVLAILKAGGAYLPIDPELPEERIQYMLYDSSTKFLMTTPGLPGKLSIINCQLLIVNDMSPESRRLNNPPKEANSINNYQLTINNLQLESSHLAYLIYTSGTTGKPGGVLITHRNLVNYVTWFTKEAGITREDKAVLVSSFAFDLGYTAVYPSLLNGAQLHIAAREVYLSPRKLIDYIALSGITFIKLTPSLYSTLAAEPGFPREISKNLKLVVLGGETINVKDIQKSIAGNRLKIMNHYGPTEATIGSVAHLIDPGKIDNYKKYPTIGKPIHNTKVFILDKDLKLLPRGVPGELCIAGIGVARGYLNNPELTFERFCLRRSGTPRRGGPICCANRLYRFSFVSGLGRDMMRNSLLSFPSSHLPNFSASLFSPPRKNFSLEAPGSRIYRSYRSHMSYIYRTGDLAKWLFNGNIIFLGRIDRQVKIRGFRIETGEIENRLLKYKGIQSAVVLPSPDNRSLCAYYVPAKNAHFTIHRLEEFLAKFLPRHMVPAYFVSLDSIPLTPNRKVDKKALPHPGKQRQTQYIAPRNEIEKKLSGIWSQLLKKEKIGIDDNFFQLGGNSIDLIRFVSTAYREFGIELPVTHVYGNPRISAISQYIISGQLAESEYVLLNPGKTRTLFAFPPGVGYGLVYKNLSLQLDEYSIYAFNFIEGENRLEKYMEIITALQSTGPYILLGWSAAGGIIFEVTAYLEKKGCKVSDIILLDAYWKKDKPTVDNDRQQLEMSDEFLKGVERELELLEMEFYRERVFKKIEKYREYNLNLRELETVGARVHLIAAADNVNPEQYSDWEEFTLNTFKIYKGFGAHVDMLSPGTLEKNAALIKTIL
jgi:amino acid adenylation domain-containing protein